MNQKQNADLEAGEQDICRPVEVDGETVIVRGSGELTEQGQEALAALVRVAKAKFVADAPDTVGMLQNRLRLAHKARRAKEHELDGIRRALCDAGFRNDDDPYGHADLADVIRQIGEQPGGEEAKRLPVGAVVSELHRRTARLAELMADPESREATRYEVRGEVMGLRGALGICLGGTVPGGTADHLGHDYYQAWLARKAAAAEELDR
jgi:hypothetical protein